MMTFLIGVLLFVIPLTFLLAEKENGRDKLVPLLLSFLGFAVAINRANTRDDYLAMIVAGMITCWNVYSAWDWEQGRDHA